MAIRQPQITTTSGVRQVAVGRDESAEEFSDIAVDAPAPTLVGSFELSEKI